MLSVGCNQEVVRTYSVDYLKSLIYSAVYNKLFQVINTMNDTDLDQIVKAIKLSSCECKFTHEEREQIRHSTEFFENINKILSKSGNTARDTIVRVTVTGMIAVIGWGIITIVKAKAMVMP